MVKKNMNELDIDRIIRNMGEFERWKVSVNAKLGEMWFKLSWKDPNDVKKRVAIEHIVRMLDLIHTPKQSNLQPVLDALKNIGMSELVPDMDMLNEWYKGNY